MTAVNGNMCGCGRRSRGVRRCAGRVGIGSSLDSGSIDGVVRADGKSV